MERSLFLIKPDGVSNTEMKIQLSAEIKRAKLSIIRCLKLQLCKRQIYNLWPRTYTDSIYGYLMLKYLGGEELELWLVEGYSAIQKAKQIKIFIRQTYSKLDFVNCVHTPSNYQEYIKDYEIIFNNVSISENIRNNNIFYTEICFSEKEYQAAAEVIWKRLQSENFVTYIKNFRLRAKEEQKIIVIIDEDDYHLIDYYIRVFFKFFSGISLADAYYYALCIDKVGYCPIYMSNNETDINSIVNFMKNNFLEVRIEQ